MKKATLLLAFGSLLMFSNVFAQAKEEVKVKKGEVSHESQEKKMHEELNLSEEQKAEMKAIKEKYSEKEQAQKEQMMALKNSMKELRQAKREEMHSVLTPEQKEKAEAHHKKMMKKKKAQKAMHKNKEQVGKERHK